ncbi:metallophosphoesterase family protein [Zestomonas thermotolerans]|uniref:metallophosphoesterase family protein n=1 Tax=Zestomonas thermotolerans TaxID=157784 RepID=UPI0014613694|nr:metallophosphoesterase family protein [Pseudomonas thermotolerans]
MRSNSDTAPWATQLPTNLQLSWHDVCTLFPHDAANLPDDLYTAHVRMAIRGHPHEPLIGERDGLLLANPGGAGARRFRLPINVARLHPAVGRVHAELLELCTVRQSGAPGTPRRHSSPHGFLTEASETFSPNFSVV